MYGVYKKGNWAFSLGVGPVAGGGTATFDNGLPSFEIPISKAVPALAGLSQISPNLAVTGYDLDMELEASSIFWGIQLGATYDINEVISVYGGVRVMPSVNTYKGFIKNVKLIAGGQTVAAPEFLTSAAGMVNNLAQVAYTAASGLQPLMDLGAGVYTLDQLETNQYISAQQRAQIEGGLLALGVSQAAIDQMNLGTVQGAYTGAGNQLAAQGESLSQNAASMEDRYVDVKQKGMGFTPIIAVNISPNDDWNIALKYEHKTYLKLENETTVDDMGLFPDKAETQYDVPAIFTAGVGYRGLKWLEAQLSYNLYFDKGVSYGNNVRYQTTGQQILREIDKNYYELALGLQFNLSDKFAISVGGLKSDMGVSDVYQSDFSFSNSSHTLAGGISWKLTDRITLDAGVLNTFYQKEKVTFADPVFGNYDESYQKTTLSLSAGISYSIF